jgi:hypothetical protein
MENQCTVVFIISIIGKHHRDLIEILKPIAEAHGAVFSYSHDENILKGYSRNENNFRVNGSDPQDYIEYFFNISHGIWRTVEWALIEKLRDIDPSILMKYVLITGGIPPNFPDGCKCKNKNELLSCLTVNN